MKDATKFILILGAFTMLAIAGQLKADTGSEGATRTERGSYMSARTISVSSNTGTTLFAASVKRPDGICRNNSAITIWIGTNTNTANGYIHENISGGFPVLSSETFKLDGSMTGTIAATGDANLGAVNPVSVNVRCLDGLVQ